MPHSDGPRRRARTAASALALASLLLAGTATVASSPAHADTPLSPLGTIVHPVSGVYVTTGTDEAYSTPAVAELIGGGNPELVVGSLDGALEVYELPSRRLLWRTSVGRSAIQSSPVVADLDGDGRNETIVGNGLAVLSAHEADGSRPAGWPKLQGEWVVGTPGLGDWDGDGVAEIAHVRRDGVLLVWRTKQRASKLKDWPRFGGNSRNTGVTGGG